MRKYLSLLLLPFILSACMMNWYHPFQSEYVRDTQAKLAAGGDTNALYAMGDAYCCGPKGGFYDTEKAMEYWCQAAKKGHGPSQLALGKLYENSYRMIGNTIPKNDLKAYMWYSAAEAGGSAEAGELKRYLEQSMTPENLERAKALVPNWQKSRCVLLKDPAGPWDPAWVAAQEEAAKKAKEKDFSKPFPANTQRRRR